MKVALIFAAIVALAFNAQATVIYDQDFTTAPTLTDNGTNNEAYFGSDETGGSPVNNFAVGDFVYSSGNTTAAVNSSAFDFAITREDRNRSRGFGVIIDTSGESAGAYSLTFDVSNYVSGGTGDGITLNVWEARNIGGNNYLNIQHGANNGTRTAPDFSTPRNSDDSGGNGANNSLGSQAITANGAVTYDFTLTEAGGTGDYLYLNWTLNHVSDSGGLPSFTLDNILVSSVPEPSNTFALVVFIMVALIARRRRKIAPILTS